MKTEALPRRARERLRQRQEMLAAAYDLFSQNGYHDVSMHQIAERAEFAIGTLYKVFQNKEDLYRSLVLDICDKFEEAVTRAIEEAEDEVEKLRNYIRAKGERIREHLSFFRLFLAERRGVGFSIKAGLDEELRKRHYAFIERLGLIFDSAIKKKRFRKITDPFYLAVALDSVHDAFLLLWLDAPEQYPYPEDPEAVLDVFFKGLLEP